MELLRLIGLAEPGSAGHGINRAVCTNLGLLTNPELEVAGAAEVAIENKESEKPNKELIVRAGDIEGQLSLLLLWIIVLLSMNEMEMSKFQGFESSLKLLASKNSNTRLVKRIHELVIRADNEFKKMEVYATQKLQGRRGAIPECYHATEDQWSNRTRKLVKEVLNCFIVTVVKLDSFLNYVGNLEPQSSRGSGYGVEAEHEGHGDCK
ncbi:hypothetical protein CDL15_Pgr011239 [Punica granatum]|uniref:Uncharacterized protein n=1 Tax=Punica granatum TaxID=22663 RepID=A0A218WGF6_PUNGR|nr:hypothetical protein CDL15_Pgr011239 [Punica granatum]